ncbi:MAG: hypothetical protein RMK18_00975 [Armatimonadota bacterium]|nr:hypothetical protein [Armatimonadota bacterium]MCX7776886.1 hypothetical protein [Armatimonadota bacterium]MDW8024428.1 hypothetical protein [Armatimonadota bacterium]
MLAADTYGILAIFSPLRNLAWAWFKGVRSEARNEAWCHQNAALLKPSSEIKGGIQCEPPRYRGLHEIVVHLLSPAGNDIANIRFM